jgi:hypothetical protein
MRTVPRLFVVKWRITTPDQQRSLIAPVLYGQVPEGLNEDVSAAPVLSGGRYRVDLLVWTSNGVATAVGSALFAQP